MDYSFIYLCRAAAINECSRVAVLRGAIQLRLRVLK